MAHYGTQDFERMAQARDGLTHIPVYQIELAARRMRAEAFADLTRKAAKAVRDFFAARPAPAAVTTPRLSELDKARLAQGEAIAHNVIALQTKVRDFFAAGEPATAAVKVEAYQLSEQDRDRLAQAEAIAEAVIAVSRFVKALAAPLVARFQDWRMRARTRDELESLDDRTLADIGLTRNDIPRVAAGVWVPENRAVRTTYAAPAPALNVNKPQIAA